MKSTAAPENIDDYISSFTKEIRDVLTEVRATIKKAAPEAMETISYGIPTFVLHGPLVHFAAFKNHIGFYATPTGNEAFEKKLAGYKMGRGSVQFPLNQTMPFALISEIVKYRLEENKAKAKEKAAPKSSKKESGKKENNSPGFMQKLSAPAQRALEANGLTTLEKVSNYTEKELLALHGVGKTTIPKIKEALSAKGLQLKVK